MSKIYHKKERSTKNTSKETEEIERTENQFLEFGFLFAKKLEKNIESP